MTPGRELDALVAEKVMGAKIIKSAFSENPEHWSFDIPGRPIGSPFAQLPYYSTNIGAAWEIMEKMRAAGFSAEISIGGEKDENWTIELAICLAALKAVGWKG